MCVFGGLMCLKMQENDAAKTGCAVHMSAVEDGGSDDKSIAIRIVRTRGPLFVCEDASVFLQRYPQMRKKHHSSEHISIEELEYLSRIFGIVFINSDDAQHCVCLRERYRLSCRAYRYLTDEMGLQLRHGSQFGAVFVGYRDVKTHGDYLVYLGPLSPLETVAAARVACSVSKEAWVVEELRDQKGFSVTRLGRRQGQHNNAMLS